MRAGITFSGKIELRPTQIINIQRRVSEVSLLSVSGGRSPARLEELFKVRVPFDVEINRQ